MALKPSSGKKPIKIWHPYLPDDREIKGSSQSRKPPQTDQDPIKSLQQIPLWPGIYKSPFNPAVWSRLEQQIQLGATSMSMANTSMFPFGNFPPISKVFPRNLHNPLISQMGTIGGLSQSSDLINSCAHCGAAFRLTSDLVQHMRTQHRKKTEEEHQDKSSPSVRTNATKVNGE